MIVRIYHKEQAVASRLIAGAAILSLGVFGYLEISWSRFLSPREIDGKFRLPYVNFPEHWGQAVGVIFLVGLVVAGYIVLNRPRIVKFLVAVETEVRKVSWPTRRQVMGSAAVVIVTMLMLAAYLFLVDLGLTWVIKRVMG